MFPAKLRDSVLRKTRCTGSVTTMLLLANLREEIQATQVEIRRDVPFQVCELHLDKNAQSLNPPFLTRPAVPHFYSICCVTSALIWAPRSTKAQQDGLRTGCWPPVPLLCFCCCVSWIKVTCKGGGIQKKGDLFVSHLLVRLYKTFWNVCLVLGFFFFLLSERSDPDFSGFPRRHSWKLESSWDWKSEAQALERGRGF